MYMKACRPRRTLRLVLTVLAFILASARAMCAADKERLVNPGFDTDPVQAGWELNVYGATPRIQRDTQVFHSGQSALRISAGAPSDTALGQEIRLEPGTAYV